MELKQAEKLAADLVGELALLCERIEVVGSIRRRCPQVKDIDIVLIPKSITLLDT